MNEMQAQLRRELRRPLLHSPPQQSEFRSAERSRPSGYRQRVMRRTSPKDSLRPDLASELATVTAGTCSVVSARAAW